MLTVVRYFSASFATPTICISILGVALSVPQVVSLSERVHSLKQGLVFPSGLAERLRVFLLMIAAAGHAFGGTTPFGNSCLTIVLVKHNVAGLCV